MKLRCGLMGHRWYVASPDWASIVTYRCERCGKIVQEEVSDKQGADLTDQEEAKRYADVFIDLVNNEHFDVIPVSRHASCRIRDHIEYLRRFVASLQEPAE